jgi:tetratricopeptide (TPR) repeat protein
MNRIGFLSSAALALALVATDSPALAQTETVQPGNMDADRLADEMRILAQNPRDLEALLRAGDLSARLGDSAAALAFFSRAETVEASNPRILAGRGAVLVRMERPGEALRLFQAAEARGVPVIAFAADRGLAYDLLGAPQLAQRDYKLALGNYRDDETVRRYALSLGITGKPEEAMAELDSLLRKSDRASWRARAFILAMNGDIPGAQRIASSMMPGNMGAALSPFFQRLPKLSVTDRAFAVHFGELSPTQARLADARIAPPVPAYVPEPPRQMVAALPPPAPAPPPVATHAPAAKSDARRRPRRGEELAAVTSAAVAPPAPQPQQPVVQTAQANPLPPPPAFVPPPMVQPVPAPTPAPVPSSTSVTRFTGQPARGGGDEAEAAPPARRARPGVRRIGEEDSVLASIVSGITIPDSEREAIDVVEEIPAPAPEPAPPPKVEPKPEPKPVKVAAATSPATIGKAVAKPTKAETKKTPAKPDPKKTDPARVWVQVAGGANEKTLPATWKKLAKEAPAAFKGRSPWTTPLRATNRLLAGPFKNANEAQGFVNTLRKADISAFVFTSEAGQKISKLTVK